MRGDAADREPSVRWLSMKRTACATASFSAGLCALRQEQAAQDAVQSLRALDLTGFAGPQAEDELRKLLLEMQRGGRREHLSAAVKGDDLFEKCARVRSVEVQPERFCVTVCEKAVRSAAVHERSLSALDRKFVIGADAHRPGAHIEQIEVAVAFEMRDLAVVAEIIIFIVVIMPGARDVVEQSARDRAGVAKKRSERASTPASSVTFMTAASFL